MKGKRSEHVCELRSHAVWQGAETRRETDRHGYAIYSEVGRAIECDCKAVILNADYTDSELQLVVAPVEGAALDKADYHGLILR